MKKIISLLLIFVILCAQLCSCAEERDAHSMMSEFCSSFGIGSAIYSPTVPEGEEGYVKEGFFKSLFAEEQESVSDYAVVLLSGLDSAGECGVFVCRSAYDALLVTEMLERRTELVRSVAAAAGLSFPDEPFILRDGKCVVLCILPDASRARRIWKHII